MSATRWSDVAPNIAWATALFSVRLPRIALLCVALGGRFPRLLDRRKSQSSRVYSCTNTTGDHGPVGVWWQSTACAERQQHKCRSEGYFCKDGTCVQRFIAPSSRATCITSTPLPVRCSPLPAKCPWQPQYLSLHLLQSAFPLCVFGNRCPRRAGKPRTLAYGGREQSSERPSRRGVFLFADAQADTPAHDC